MVSELKGTNQSNKNRSLDLSALGDAAKQSISAGEKPILKEPVRGQIVNIDLQVQEVFRSNRDNPNQRFHPCLLKVKTKFVDPATQEAVTSTDNYSGLRFYPKTDETGQLLLDANGDEVLDRFWSGDGSDFGKLLNSAQVFNEKIVTYNDFFQFLLSGPNCVIETQFRNNPQTNKQTHKEFISRFI